jgi:hypothetical protein
MVASIQFGPPWRQDEAWSDMRIVEVAMRFKSGA